MLNFGKPSYYGSREPSLQRSAKTPWSLPFPPMSGSWARTRVYAVRGGCLSELHAAGAAPGIDPGSTPSRAGTPTTRPTKAVDRSRPKGLSPLRVDPWGQVPKPMGEGCSKALQVSECGGDAIEPARARKMLVSRSRSFVRVRGREELILA